MAVSTPPPLPPPCPRTAEFLKTGIPNASGSLPHLAHLPSNLIVLMVYFRKIVSLYTLLLYRFDAAIFFFYFFFLSSIMISNALDPKIPI
jgi:hypothetical protein